MLGSHDSFTYLKSTNSLMNTITDFWRTQNATITEQYKFGVRFFDVRVAKETTTAGKHVWRVCHGFATLDKTFVSLSGICKYFDTTLPGSILRLVLEHNDARDEFIKEVTPLCTGENCIVEVAIKSPWERLYCDFKRHPKYISLYYEPWNTGTDTSTWDKLKKFIKTISTIKSYAKKHNPKITQDMIDDPTVVYFMDYVTGKY